MDWKTFIVQLIGILAWPLVVMVVCIQLKGQLSELMLRLRKLKHNETELEFSEKLNALTMTSIEQQESLPKIEIKPEIVEQENFLLRLSEISPRSSVIEAFRVLESAYAKAIANTYPEINKNQSLAPMEKIDLLNGKILSKSQYVQFHALKELRNRAAHMEDFELESTPIEKYVEIALSLANYLENYKP